MLGTLYMQGQEEHLWSYKQSVSMNFLTLHDSFISLWNIKQKRGSVCIWFLGDLNDLGLNTASQIWESPLQGRYIYGKNIIYFLLAYHEQGFLQELHKHSPIVKMILKGCKKQIWNIYETNLKKCRTSLYNSLWLNQYDHRNLSPMVDGSPKS